MIDVEEGKEQDNFITFVENALGVLAKEDYTSFLALFDISRLTEQDIILALRYLDETQPVLKVDNPALVKSKYQDISLIPFRDGSGYHMDYDLTTNGKRNDLTIQFSFLKEADRYIISLDDLHTL